MAGWWAHCLCSFSSKIGKQFNFRFKFASCTVIDRAAQPDSVFSWLTQFWCRAVCAGGVSASLSGANSTSNMDVHTNSLVVRSSCLDRNLDKMFALVQELTSEGGVRWHEEEAHLKTLLTRRAVRASPTHQIHPCSRPLLRISPYDFSS